MAYELRPATAADVGSLAKLIEISARELCAPDYTDAQIETALRGAFGVDSQLIRDGTYFLIETAGELAACGGWSRRATLFGGDAGKVRDATQLDPKTQPARVRAFFVHPSHARRGLGRMLLTACESAAREAGFGQVELMATLTGAKLYAACGYVPRGENNYEAAPGTILQFIPMSKQLSGVQATSGD